jgi:hypothetical protein
MNLHFYFLAERAADNWKAGSWDDQVTCLAITLGY